MTADSLPRFGIPTEEGFGFDWVVSLDGLEFTLEGEQRELDVAGVGNLPA